ncbi:hypothetical protein HMPREF1544_03239 [Mucor circinelloides 1006PhL]|uniref:Uncharacterized protein n=1 Tax=Mucor circinelloides f. circinelloides (strain 1006PhL) TaxID=1220926 RepID=S2KCI4_MUCC1|nr:hypothetical protein HMPREF1544_03239 [Mucor circinelloides 1006PhL]
MYNGNSSSSKDIVYDEEEQSQQKLQLNFVLSAPKFLVKVGDIQAILMPQNVVMRTQNATSNEIRSKICPKYVKHKKNASVAPARQGSEAQTLSQQKEQDSRENGEEAQPFFR